MWFRVCPSDTKSQTLTKLPGQRELEPAKQLLPEDLSVMGVQPSPLTHLCVGLHSKKHQMVLVCPIIIDQQLISLLPSFENAAKEDSKTENPLSHLSLSLNIYLTDIPQLLPRYILSPFVNHLNILSQTRPLKALLQPLLLSGLCIYFILFFGDF